MRAFARTGDIRPPFCISVERQGHTANKRSLWKAQYTQCSTPAWHRQLLAALNTSSLTFTSTLASFGSYLSGNILHTADSFSQLALAAFGSHLLGDYPNAPEPAPVAKGLNPLRFFEKETHSKPNQPVLVLERYCTPNL